MENGYNTAGIKLFLQQPRLPQLHELALHEHAEAGRLFEACGSVSDLS